MSDAMTAFLGLIAQNEGPGLDLTAADPGNWTGGAVGKGVLRGSFMGISAAAYPSLDIASLTPDAVAALYRRDYLDRIAFDTLPVPIAVIIGDCAINQGVGAAAIILQEALNVEADGVVGPMTVAAAAACGNNPGPIVDEIHARRALRYAVNDNVQIFGLGWFRRLIRTYRFANAA